MIFDELNINIWSIGFEIGKLFCWVVGRSLWPNNLKLDPVVSSDLLAHFPDLETTPINFQSSFLGSESDRLAATEVLMKHTTEYAVAGFGDMPVERIELSTRLEDLVVQGSRLIGKFSFIL